MDWEFMYKTFWLAVKGIPVTLEITILSLIFAFPLSLIIAIVRNKKIKVFSKICGIYVSFIRGTPILVQIYLLYNLLPSLLKIALDKMGSEINIFKINPMIYAVIIFSLNISALMSEIMRSAFATVDKGQMEAAVTLGMTEWQAYYRIILPQAFVSAIPNICTLVILIIKMTSLAFTMTIQDVTAIAKIQAGLGYTYFEAYIDIFVIYLVLCICIEKIFGKLEARMKRYKNPVIA